MHIFVAGLWLPRSIWAEVATELESSRHRPIAVVLPGVDGAIPLRDWEPFDGGTK